MTHSLPFTALSWKQNGELSSRDRELVKALVMNADKRPFNLNPTKPMTYIAFIADATGCYAHVYGNANSWHQFADSLENLGCEVIENQTDDYESIDEIKECCISINDLKASTDFVAYV